MPIKYYHFKSCDNYTNTATISNYMQSVECEFAY